MRNKVEAYSSEERFEMCGKKIRTPKKYATSTGGMISTAHYLATEAGAKILKAGGNAIDAAVSAAFALGVCEPAASGLGGQSMMLLYDSKDKRRVTLDGSSRSPHRVEPGGLERKESLRGHRATTVPSTPATLAYALNRYGSMSLADVLAPAIEIAKCGYRVSPLQNFLTKRDLKHLKGRSAAEFLLKNGTSSYPVGALHRQPVLASTLERLATHGIEDFYQGEIARHIHDDMVENGGLIRDDDLAQIPWPVERVPISTTFDRKRIFTFGPPGAGRMLLEMLNILSQFPKLRYQPNSPKGALLLAKVIKKANMDRLDRPYDRHLHPQESDEELMLSKGYAERVANRLRKRIRTAGETTHLSAVDSDGNMVALTQSIERVYGSCEASPKLGFLYNNYMSAFELEDISHPYYLRPNAAPWGSVAPTLIFKGRHPWLAIGSPGSERIASAIVQVLLRLDNMDPFEAVDAPRMHCSAEGKVSLEAGRIRDDIPDYLEECGFRVDERDPYSFYLGCVQMVLREPKGKLVGVADPRRDGSASGPR